MGSVAADYFLCVQRQRRPGMQKCYYIPERNSRRNTKTHQVSFDIALD